MATERAGVIDSAAQKEPKPVPWFVRGTHCEFCGRKLDDPTGESWVVTITKGKIPRSGPPAPPVGTTKVAWETCAQCADDAFRVAGVMLQYLEAVAQRGQSNG